MQIWSTGFQMAVSVSPEEPREEKKKKTQIPRTPSKHKESAHPREGPRICIL